jgi:uncharacterized membrane protein
MSILSTFNLTVLGAFHTAIGLFAVAAGIVSLVRYGAIGPTTTAGRVYLSATLITVLTGFFIFRHGGFGNPHVLGVLTLLLLALALAAGKTQLFGRWSVYVETVAYSLSFFFHLIPGTAESLTRLPLGAPVASHPEAPIVTTVVGVFFAMFVAGATWQVMTLRAARKVLAPNEVAVVKLVA